MRFRIQRFLCYHLQLSNMEALSLMSAKRVTINQQLALPNQWISNRDTIVLDGKILQKGTEFHYFALHKPRGIECTTNPEIPENILPYLPIPTVYMVGRLDKDSEGLLLLTDDDQFYDKVIGLTSSCEKEYWVETDKSITDEDLLAFQQGIVIMGKKTKPCRAFREGDSSFRIILTQGLNRQIRRMCYKRGLQVVTLRRIRIGNFSLGNIPVGEVKKLGVEEISKFIDR